MNIWWVHVQVFKLTSGEKSSCLQPQNSSSNTSSPYLDECDQHMTHASLLAVSRRKNVIDNEA